MRSIWNMLKEYCLLIVILMVSIGALYASISISGAGSNTLSLTVEPVDEYPVCNKRIAADLSILDMASFAMMAYNVPLNEYPENELLSAQQKSCLYFDGNISTGDCLWEVVHSEITEPVFIHLRHRLSNSDVITVRGTETFSDFLQDFILFNQV